MLFNLNFKNKPWQMVNSGDVWGGLVGMLVAFPAAIAFGVTIYAPLGASHIAVGALSGILGAIIIAIVTSFTGGIRGLVTAPSAPVAALLSAFTLVFVQSGGNPINALPMLLILGFLTGWLQIVLGLLKIGKLIQYVPYSVVSGYLSGVGIYIILGQIKKLLGADKSLSLTQAIITPTAWQWQSVLIGVVTIVVMVIWINGKFNFGSKHQYIVSKRYSKIPAAIMGLVAGGIVYVILAIIDESLRVNVNNPLVIGPLIKQNSGLWETLTQHWQGFGGINLQMVEYVIGTALTLAVLLSIDTLKTCIVLSALTNSKYNPNRELISQGIGNVACALVGGLPGSGTMGATLVNVSAGARSLFSGFLIGVFSLLVLIALGGFMGWVPVSSLASILIVVGVRMIDFKSFKLARRKATRLEFVVTLVVIITANVYGLLSASAMGIALAIILFLRENIRSSIVHRLIQGDKLFSKRIRTNEEMEILETQGSKTRVAELQGSLFFGTAYQITSKLDNEMKLADYMILDFRRVQSLDLSAVNVLQNISKRMNEKQGCLIFSHLPSNLPSGVDVEEYLQQLGLGLNVNSKVDNTNKVKVFDELDLALEWVENEVLKKYKNEMSEDNTEERVLDLREMEIYAGRRDKTLEDIEALMQQKKYVPGDYIFKFGDAGDEIFLIRKGLVRISLPIEKGFNHNVGAFGRGASFGEMAFLEEGQVRSANAIAENEVTLYVLSRADYNVLMKTHKKVAMSLMENIALVLANRLRYANAEIKELES